MQFVIFCLGPSQCATFSAVLHFFTFFFPAAQIRSWTEQQMLAGLQIWMDYSDEQMLPLSQPAVVAEQIEQEALSGGGSERRTAPPVRSCMTSINK